MTIVEQIRQWLQNGQPYFPGLSIYAKVGGRVPLTYFQGYEGASYIPPNIKQQLHQCMIDALKRLPEDNEVINHVEDVSPPNVQKRKPIPRGIKVLKLKAMRLHKQHALLHNQLRECQSQDERYQICVTIMEDIIPQLDDIYDRIRAYNETGKIPVFSDNEIVRRTVQKMNKRLSLIPAVSRLKKKIEQEGLSEQDKAKYKKTLLKKLADIQQLNNELGIG